MTQPDEDWDWHEDQEYYEDHYQKQVDDAYEHGFDWLTIEQYADIHSWSLEKARYELAKRAFHNEMDVHWFDHRMFFFRRIEPEEKPKTVIEESLLKCELSSWSGDKKRCKWCDTELSGRQVNWCIEHKETNEQNHSWGVARREALRRDKYLCTALGCGGKAEEVNHKIPILGKHNEFGCWHHLENLESLCRSCHLKSTAEQKAQGLFKKSKQTESVQAPKVKSAPRISTDKKNYPQLKAKALADGHGCNNCQETGWVDSEDGLLRCPSCDGAPFVIEEVI